MEARVVTAALTPAASPHASRRWLPHGVAVGVVLTLAAGAIARVGGDDLGAPLAPFFATWRPQAGTLAIPVILMFAAAAVLAPRLLDRPRSALVFAALALGLGLALRLALAAARSGPERWYTVFS